MYLDHCTLQSKIYKLLYNNLSTVRANVTVDYSLLYNESVAVHFNHRSYKFKTDMKVSKVHEIYTYFNIYFKLIRSMTSMLYEPTSTY